MTNAEARFNKSLRPRKPEGSLGRTAQDVHLDSHTAPELCDSLWLGQLVFITPSCLRRGTGRDRGPPGGGRGRLYITLHGHHHNDSALTLSQP